MVHTRMTVLAIAAAGSAALAGPVVYDFEDLAHGEIVSGAYAPELTINGQNFRRNFDIIAAFDTRRTGTADPDLEGPGWSTGNLAVSNTVLGNALIIAENNNGASSGFLSSPDDEGGRAAGSITFSFGTAIGSFGFDLIDIESVTLENTRLAFSLRGQHIGTVGVAEFLDLASPLYDATIALGDNSANRFAPITRSLLGSSFDEVTLTLGGSGAIDNIIIPAPSAIALIGVGGLAIARRRRN